MLYLGKASQPLSQALIMMALEQRIVTLSDIENFIYDRGMIGLFVDDQHISIEINLFVAQVAGIQIRAQLLEVAKTVIKYDLELE